MIAAGTGIDFGYPWWLSYGHLVILIPAAALLAIGYRRGWRRWPMVVLALLTLWAGVATLVTRFVINVNGSPELPTQSFLRSGEGRVLDIGAGTGRSSITVLHARPKATLVALDQFGNSFNRHFGSEGTPQERLMANLKRAGVDGRATIETADMRKLPFEPASFDAVVSAYAIDHLNREGIGLALAEAARVIKPGGDFLLMLVANEAWTKFAYGPLLSHGATRGSAWWQARLREAGFRIREDGTRPLTLYILAQRE